MTAISVPIGTRELRLVDDAVDRLNYHAHNTEHVREILLDLWRTAYRDGREDASRVVRNHLTVTCGTHGERSRSAAAIRAILSELSR